MSEAVRPPKEWPGWMDDLLSFGPLAELEAEWQAAIGDAITRVLDLRAESQGAREAQK